MAVISIMWENNNVDYVSYLGLFYNRRQEPPQAAKVIARNVQKIVTWKSFDLVMTF